MIKSFSCLQTEAFFKGGKAHWLQAEVHKRAAMRLKQLAAAVEVDDLRIPPSNHLEALSGDRAGQWSIRINLRWQVCFRFRDGDAYDVEIVDYH
ncbi:plasmid maintenance system killer protein [Betaproteobacteria bacterium]|nr:plasmid maintenance system killer protein [Betaproteobacteria bacterium]GHU16178.1 plasmid maintenance system killer protein [Betaproteobacteria bacterium]